MPSGGKTLPHPSATFVAVLAATSVIVSACSLIVDTGGLAGAGEVDAGADAGAAPADASDERDARAVADSDARANTAYRDAVLSDGPVAFWPFDEVAGSAGALDIVGGKTAFAMGTVAFGGAGTVGLSLEVDGGGSIVVGDMFDFAGAVPYSLEAWIKPDVASDEFYEFFSKRASPENGYVFYVRKNSDGTTTVQFEQNSASGARGASRLVKLRVWQHVVVTFEPSDGVRLYVDGVSTLGYSDVGAAPADSTIPLQLGAGLLGSLDEVAIYASALTPDRIAAHSALGRR